MVSTGIRIWTDKKVYGIGLLAFTGLQRIWMGLNKIRIRVRVFFGLGCKGYQGIWMDVLRIWIFRLS